MPKLYVEVCRPCFSPKRPIEYRVHKEKGFSRDVLSPDMTCVFEVDNVKTKEDAIGCILEYAANMGTTVRCIFGGRKPRRSSSEVKALSLAVRVLEGEETPHPVEQVECIDKLREMLGDAAPPKPDED